MFFKDFRVTFYLQDMKIQSVFFCAQIFRRIARSITPIFFVENWLICRSHLKQFIQCKSENYSIFWLFITSSELFCYAQQFSENTQKSSISLKITKSKLIFVNRLAVVSVFLRSGTILKNDHFHCIWSVISLCSTPRAFFFQKMTMQNVNLGTFFTCLFSLWFVAPCHLREIVLLPTRSVLF